MKTLNEAAHLDITTAVLALVTLLLLAASVLLSL